MFSAILLLSLTWTSNGPCPWTELAGRDAYAARQEGFLSSKQGSGKNSPIATHLMEPEKATAQTSISDQVALPLQSFQDNVPLTTQNSCLTHTIEVLASLCCLKRVLMVMGKHHVCVI